MDSDGSHSMPAREPTQPPVPLDTDSVLALDEPKATSVLTAAPSIFTIDDSETATRVHEVTSEEASLALVNDTLVISPSTDTAPDAVTSVADLLLGGGSQDLFPTPAVPNAAEDDVAALEADIEGKYGATSAWVDTLPLTGPPAVMDGEAAAQTQAEDSATQEQRSRREKRPRQGKSDDAEDGADGGQPCSPRQRRAREKAAEAELQTAFKHSQRALRRQAKSINMKDVFARSLTLPSPSPLSGAPADAASTFPSSPMVQDGSNSGRTASGSVFSPSSFRFGPSLFSSAGAMSPTTPSGSSAWSPCVVGELTNQFLANVKHQRRQKFEQFVSRELTQSQAMSQTHSMPRHPHSHADGHDGEASHTLIDEDGHRPGDALSAPTDELVIGEEDDEAANWMPAESSTSPGSLQGRRVLRETNAKDDVVLLGASSATDEQRYTANSTANTPSPSSTTTTTAISDQRSAEELASQQQQVVQSLARKHEIWKLKQRQLKAQQQVDMDERAKAKEQQQQQQSGKPAALATLSAGGSHTRLVGDTERAGETSYTSTAVFSSTSSAGLAGSAAMSGNSMFFRSSQIASPSTVSRTAPKTSLSADAISMIRRINSFDNTSTQRVVVFGTAASLKQAREEDTQ